MTNESADGCWPPWWAWRSSAPVRRLPSRRAVTNHGTPWVTLRDRDGAEIGWAKLTESSDGRVHVNVKVAGLSPGLHGIHFHAQGTCSGPDFTTAGGHHNPLGAQHGSHAGDLPNLVVNEAGQDSSTPPPTAPRCRAAGRLFDGDGSAVIIHANPDDFVTQPTGNSGGRVACGVVTAD